MTMGSSGIVMVFRVLQAIRGLSGELYHCKWAINIE